MKTWKFFPTTCNALKEKIKELRYERKNIFANDIEAALDEIDRLNALIEDLTQAQQPDPESTKEESHIFSPKNRLTLRTVAKMLSRDGSHEATDSINAALAEIDQLNQLLDNPIPADVKLKQNKAIDDLQEQIANLESRLNNHINDYRLHWS